MKTRGIFAVMAAALRGLIGNAGQALRWQPTHRGKGGAANPRRKKTRGAFGRGPTGWRDK